MAVDHIRYDLLVREALRGVVRRVVSDAARNGLPGDHHFFIAFYTGAPGVKISPRMRAQYPEEMTIVLQHQFWDLSVTDTAIEVGLSFNGIAEKLVIPFDAMKGFFDPSVQFGLEFEVIEQSAEEAAADPAATPAPAPVAKLQSVKPEKTEDEKPPRAAREKPAKRPREEERPPAAAEETKPPESKGGEVVRLDRFRKK
jgi:hypothetical protein